MSAKSPSQRSKKRKLHLDSVPSSSTGSKVDASAVADIPRQIRRLTSNRALYLREGHVVASQPHAFDNVHTPSYYDVGNCDHSCEYCGARFWFAERLRRYGANQRPKYNQCCKGGRVRLHVSKDPPSAVKQLHQRAEFMDNIRAYNSMFSMTSFGASIDEAINNGLAPYVFKVHGQICHWIGSLCPPQGESPRFLQMYVYDTEHELDNRLRFFSGHDSRHLNTEIVQTLIHTLENSNELVKLFSVARDICSSNEIPDFAIHLYNSPKERSYDTPSYGTLGGIVYEDHDPSPHPKYRYCMTATITDDTSFVTAVLFDEAMATLIDITCDSMVKDEHLGDPQVLPPHLKSLIGKRMLFEVQARNTNKHRASIVINKAIAPPVVTPDPVTPTAADIQPTSIINSTTKECSPTPKTQSPVAPAVISPTSAHVQPTTITNSTTKERSPTPKTQSPIEPAVISPTSADNPTSNSVVDPTTEEFTQAQKLSPATPAPKSPKRSATPSTDEDSTKKTKI